MRVLEVLDPPDGTTRYVDQIVESLPSDVVLGWFTWKGALTGSYDVLHVHWPERMTRSPQRWKQPFVRLAFCVLLLRLRLTRTPIVRTEHNVGPHEAGDRVEGYLLRWLDRRTVVAIQLNPTTAVDPRRQNVMIRLGHYRDRFAQYEKPPVEPGRLVYFGLIRPYKGVDRLLEAMAQVEDRGVSLRVVGRPQSPFWRDLVTAATLHDPRVTALLEFVDDATLVREVAQAALVVLPFRELHNSATVLVALSLDRAVLVPRTPSTEALAAEVGTQWVQMFEGELTAEVLTAALDRAATATPGARPDLPDRDWSLIGPRHAQAYRAAVLGAKNHPLPVTRNAQTGR